MTYSIVARDPQTGELAVAVQSHYFGVGRLCPFVRAGVGAVATQASVDPSYGPLGIQLMEAGKSPAEALAALVDADADSAIRQVAMIDTEGRVAAHTGDTTIADASHVVGDQFSAQANMMTSPGVPEAMAAAFTTAAGDLVDRILSALDAAEVAGGDIRGRQSAALLVSSGERVGVPGADLTWDLRVDDHPEPLEELRRLVKVKRAYDGDFISSEAPLEKIEEALAEIEDLTGGNPEMAFWAAVTLANAGRLAEARGLVRRCYEVDPRWLDLLGRLIRTERIDQATFEALIEGIA